MIKLFRIPVRYLKKLLDTALTPSDGDILYYEAATKLWKTKAEAGGGDMSKAVYDPNEDGVVALAQLDPLVCSEAEADAKITTHKNIADAHHTKTTNAAELTSGELPTARLTANIKTLSITFIIDGGGSAITTGQKGHLEIPFACTINQVTMLADQSGSIVVDIWKDIYANFPPTDADSITASAPPTITTAQKSQDATLTGWTAAIAAGDILAFNVDSCATITRVTIALKVEKS